MKLAYLVNQYPSPSHTFIRREIAALEAMGTPVERFSIRRPEVPLVDPRDQAELAATRAVLGAGRATIVTAVLGAMLRHPRGFGAAAARAARWGWRSVRGLPLSVAYLAEACILATWLRRAEVTHLHVHFGTNAVVVAALAELIGGPSYSFTVHGPEEFDRPEGLKLREKVASARFVVAVSEYGRSQLYRWMDPADWTKVHVVRCGLDASFLANEPTEVPDRPRLVSVGRLSEQKGQLVLLEAVSRLIADSPEIGLEVVLVGDGPMRPQVEEAIGRLDLGGTVRLAGVLSNDDVRREVEAARAMVLPSFAEGLPVVIMETLARGRPVVSTYVAGIPELVDASCGWLVPAGSVDRLVDALREVVDAAPHDLAQMGRTGRARVLERHDAQRESSRLAGLFARAASPPAGTVEG